MHIRTDAALQFALLVVVESMQTTAMGTWEGVALWRFRTWGWSRELASVYWGILLSTAFPLALVYPPRTRNRHRVVLLSCASTAGSMLQLGSSDRVADVVLFTLGSVLQLASSQISRGYLWGRLIALSETSTFPRTLQAISCVVYGTSVGGGLLLSGWIEDRYAYATVNVALGVTALLLCTFVSETHLSQAAHGLTVRCDTPVRRSVRPPPPLAGRCRRHGRCAFAQCLASALEVAVDQDHTEPDGDEDGYVDASIERGVHDEHRDDRRDSVSQAT